MSIRVIHDTELNVWGEVTAGTRPNPVTKAAQLPIISAEIGVTENRSESEVISSTRQPTKPSRGTFEFAGRNITVPLQAGATGVLLYKFFEDYSVSGSAPPYTHVFKSGGSYGHSPYLGIELWNAGVSKGDVYDGCILQSLQCDIRGDSNRQARFVFGLTGLAKPTFDTTAKQDATPTTFSGSFWNESDVEVLIDGSASLLITSASFNLQRQISVRKVFDGTRYQSILIPGGIQSATLELTGLWDDTSAVRSLATGISEHIITLKFRNPDDPTTKYLEIKFPEVQCYLTAVPAIASGGNEIEISVEGGVYFEDSADGAAVVATLVDDTATYVGLID